MLTRPLGLIKVRFYLVRILSNPKTLRSLHELNFLVIFGYIWGEIVFLKGLVRFREIRKIEDLMKLKLGFVVNNL